MWGAECKVTKGRSACGEDVTRNETSSEAADTCFRTHSELELAGANPVLYLEGGGLGSSFFRACMGAGSRSAGIEGSQSEF